MLVAPTMKFKYLAPLLVLVSSSALADTSVWCDAPAGASTGMALSIALDGSVSVLRPEASEHWLVFSKTEDVSIFVTLVSMRPMAEGSSQYTWERLQYQLDRRDLSRADAFLSRLENRRQAPLNSRLLENGPTTHSRVDCQVAQ